MTTRAANYLKDDPSTSSIATAPSHGASYASYTLVFVILPLVACFVWILSALYGRTRRRRQISKDNQAQRQAIRNRLTIKTLSEGSIDLEGIECAICLDRLTESQLVCESPYCAHRFHADCAEEWFLKSLHCPVCRVAYLSSDQAVAVPEAKS